jgi:hypothetical protein
MGREIQKKKRRSARQPVRQPRKPKNALNPRGNAMIAKNWYVPSWYLWDASLRCCLNSKTKRRHVS